VVVLRVVVLLVALAGCRVADSVAPLEFESRRNGVGCTNSTYISMAYCYADEYYLTGDSYCQAYAVTTWNYLNAYAVTTMPNALYMSGGRALGYSNGPDDTIYSSESYDLFVRTAA
jgi:hypothetical protein